VSVTIENLTNGGIVMYEATPEQRRKYDSSDVAWILLQKITDLTIDDKPAFIPSHIVAWNPFKAATPEKKPQPLKKPLFYIFHDSDTSKKIAVFWPTIDSNQSQNAGAPFALVLAMYREIINTNSELACDRLIIPLATTKMRRAHWLGVGIDLNNEGKITNALIIDPKSKLSKWYDLSYIEDAMKENFNFADNCPFASTQNIPRTYIEQQAWNNFVDCGPHIIETMFLRLIIGNLSIDKEKPVTDTEMKDIRKIHNIIYERAKSNKFLPLDSSFQLNNIPEELISFFDYLDIPEEFKFKFKEYFPQLNTEEKREPSKVRELLDSFNSSLRLASRVTLFFPDGKNNSSTPYNADSDDDLVFMEDSDNEGSESDNEEKGAKYADEDLKSDNEKQSKEESGKFTSRRIRQSM
jgi:hypothetical protein